MPSFREIDLISDAKINGPLLGRLQSWPKTMWTVAFDQLFEQKCKIYRSFFNPPAPLNNVVLQYVV